MRKPAVRVCATVLVLGLGLLFPRTAAAQLRVIISGGFAPVYREVLPEFERAQGISVLTESGSSQGTGPTTIAAQLKRGVQADVVILSKEGLADLVADGRIIAGTPVDLGSTPTALAVRTGAIRPDIATVASFTKALLDAERVAIPGSTTGTYLTTKLFPSLGIADRVRVTLTARGAESTGLVAAGNATMAVQPLSELMGVAGLDVVGPIPADVQFVSVFSGAVVAGTQQAEAARALLTFLSSARTTAAMARSGMDPIRR